MRRRLVTRVIVHCGEVGSDLQFHRDHQLVRDQHVGIQFDGTHLVGVDDLVRGRDIDAGLHLRASDADDARRVSHVDTARGRIPTFDRRADGSLDAGATPARQHGSTTPGSADHHVHAAAGRSRFGACRFVLQQRRGHRIVGQGYPSHVQDRVGRAPALEEVI